MSKTQSCSPLLKQYLSRGLALVFLVSALPAQALRFEPTDELGIDLDTTLAYGAMWRVDERRDDLGQSDWVISHPVYRPFANIADPAHEDRIIQWGSDDGTRNFEKGDLVSNRVAVLSDMDMRYGDYGLFLRGQMFYDSVYFEETSWDAGGEGDYLGWDVWNNDAVFDCDNNGVGDTSDGGGGFPASCGDGSAAIFNGLGTYAGPESINNVMASGFISDPSHFSDQVKERHGYDARFLDAYVYGTFNLGDRTLDLRLGDQAINWGEALLLQGGIGFALNRIDAAAATSPGVQLKEIFLPTGSLYGQLNLTDTFTLEAYWQYEYEPSELFEAGSYWGQEDFLGSNIFHTNLRMFDSCMFGSTETAGSGADISGVGGSTLCNSNPPTPSAVGLEHTLGAFNNAFYRSEDKLPDQESDQFGVALRTLLDGGSEIGMFFVQYHDKYPSIWANNNGAEDTAIFSQRSLGPYADPTWTGNPNGEISMDAPGFNNHAYTVEYKERIKLYGLTYNTVFGDIQVGFELTYRENQPVVPACDAETLGAANISFDESLPEGTLYEQWAKAQTLESPCKDASLRHWLGNEGVWNWATNDYQTPAKADEVANRLFAWPTEAEVFTYNVGVTAVVPPSILWDTGILVAEFGGFEVGSGFEDKDLKVTTAGAFTQNGYGVSGIFLPQYKNVMEGVDLTIPFFVNYTIEGSFAYFNYQEESLWVSVGAEAVYLSNFTTGITYSVFNSANRWSDRDNIAVTMKYSF